MAGYRLVVLALSMASLNSESLQGDVKEYCNMETFEAKCKSDEVVVMETARYGRMNIGRCAETDYGNLGCSVDVIRYADALCSGRRECSVKIPDDRLYETRPCPKDVTSYLEASYKCTKVLSGGSLQKQCREQQSVTLTATEGLLASVVSEEARLGTRHCPYVIQARAGQRVSVILIDFGLDIGHGETRSSIQPSYCHKYAVIGERTGVSPTTVCSGRDRQRSVYLSETDRVEIQIVTGVTVRGAHFLLKYTMVGCTHPVTKGNTVLERTAEKAVLQCNYTGERWNLVCKGSDWVGEINNCSVIIGGWSVWRTISEEWTTPYGILVVVGLGAALGIVIGFALLTVALLYMKRRRLRARRRATEMEPVYDEYGRAADLDLDHVGNKQEVVIKADYNNSKRSTGTDSHRSAHYHQMWKSDVLPMAPDERGGADRPNTEGGGVGVGPGAHIPSLEPTSQRNNAVGFGPYGGLDHVYERPK